MLSYFLDQIAKNTSLLPVIIDQTSALLAISRYSWREVLSIDECRTGNIPHVFLYEKDEEKKHLSIANIRTFIDEVSIQPYNPTSLYILRDFDTATPDAMNATLKILEEPPTYAIILLIVSNPAALLETIHSRTMNLYSTYTQDILSDELKDDIRDFFRNNPKALLKKLHEGKITREEAISLLAFSIPFLQWEKIAKVEQSIIELYKTNENPRNILDRVFLVEI